MTVRRWHGGGLWCFRGKNAKPKAEAFIRRIERESDYKAKIWRPLPQHKNSGHVHVVVLCKPKEIEDIECIRCGIRIPFK